MHGQVDRCIQYLPDVFLIYIKIIFRIYAFSNINFNYIFKTIIRYIIRCLIKSHGFGLSMLLLYYIGMYVAL